MSCCARPLFFLLLGSLAACGDSGPTDSDAKQSTDTVDENGGTVSHLYFAVVGDVQPPDLDDTAEYPTATINRIFSQIQALSPRPQFVLATGDYMFATPTGSEGPIQLGLFMSAASKFDGGPLFAAFGNHECDGWTRNNCESSAGNNNYGAFMEQLVVPLGKSQPYYSLDFQTTDYSASIKLIIIACNAWSSTQASWLASELARPSTYTIVVRHEPADTTAPCIADTEQLLEGEFDLLIQGHTHLYAAEPALHTLTVGASGASTSGTTGYTTIGQLAAGGFTAREYDTATGTVVSVDNFSPRDR